MNRRKLFGGTAVALLLASTATPALAGSNVELLKRLHEKGILTDDEYQSLVAQDQAAPPPAPTSAPAETAQASLGDKTVVHRTPTGVGLIVGDITFKVGGSVNGFYVHDSAQAPGPTTAVTGGIASVGSNSSAVRNGLLPGYITFDVTTTQGGWDVGAHFGMYPGINSAAYGALGANNGGQPTGLGTAGIDFRQTNMTFGKPGIGTFKIGRDIGLFGSDAILNDITLLSSGPTGGNVAPSNTTLGRIGSGYIYTDFQPQITYTSPKFAGLQVAAGVFEPLHSLTGPAEKQTSPGFQGKITFDGKMAGVAAHLWVSGITQKHDGVVAGTSYTGSGIDGGAKLTVGPVTAVGYYYRAAGLGTTALNLFDSDGAGGKRDSEGFYLQAMATVGKFSLGGSYGESKLDYANAADALANPTLVHKNSSWVGQARYGLTSWVTLIAEYMNTKSKAHNGNTAESNAVAGGAILFF